MNKIALVLGSGGFRGAAHIGVLTRLRDLHVPVYAMVGCSVGSLITAYYAALGLPVEDLLQFALETGFAAVVAHALSMRKRAIAAGLPGAQADPVQRRLSLLDRCDFRHLRHGVQKVGFLMHDLRRGERLFAVTGREKGLSLTEAARASSRLPGVFPPLCKEVDGLERALVDGALSCPTPVLHAVCSPISATHVIAVELSSSRGRRRKSRLDLWKSRLGDRLAIIRPTPPARVGIWGCSTTVRAWHQAGLEAVDPSLSAQIAGWSARASVVAPPERVDRTDPSIPAAPPRRDRREHPISLPAETPGW